MANLIETDFFKEVVKEGIKRKKGKTVGTLGVDPVRSAFGKSNKTAADSIYHFHLFVNIKENLSYNPLLFNEF